MVMMVMVHSAMMIWWWWCPLHSDDDAHYKRITPAQVTGCPPWGPWAGFATSPRANLCVFGTRSHHSSYCSTKRRKQRRRRSKLVYQIYQPHESFWYSSNWNDLYHWTILHLVFVSLLLSVFSVLCVRSLKTNIAFAFTLQAAKPEHKKTTKMPPLALSPFCLSRLSDELSLFSDRVSMNCSEKIA